MVPHRSGCRGGRTAPPTTHKRRDSARNAGKIPPALRVGLILGAGEQARAEGKPAGVVAGRVAKVAARTLPLGMLAAIVIDLLLDGILIGLGVRLGATQGIILTIALTLEILFLALSVTGELREAGLSKARAVAVCAGLGLTTAIGAIGGAALLGGVDTTVLSAILGVGAAALLYLVVEELLVEAHEVKESMLLSANFFLGFILIYILSSLE